MQKTMIDRKNVATIILVALVVLLSYFLVGQHSALNKAEGESARKELAMQAIFSAQVEKRVEDSLTLYKKQAPQISVEDVLASPAFAGMRGDQRRFFESLRRDSKNLVAAARARLSKADTIYVTKIVREASGSTDSTICFARNSKTQLQDTTKMLKWRADIVFANPLGYHFTYTYKPTISASFARDKAKGTTVEFKLDDPDLAVTDIQSIVIPPDEVGRTRAGKWLHDNRAVLRYTGATAIFGAGVYAGAALVK